jgi:hypothetical protein
MTLSIMTLSIMTLSIITLIIMTLSIMTLSIMTRSIMILGIFTQFRTTLSIKALSTVAKLRHSAYHLSCAENNLCTVLLRGVMLNVVAPESSQ